MTTTPTATSVTLAADIIALHNRLHTLFSWAKTIDVSFGLSYVEVAVYWRADSAYVSRQRIKLGPDFDALFDYACNLLRQAYQQTL